MFGTTLHGKSTQEDCCPNLGYWGNVVQPSKCNIALITAQGLVSGGGDTGHSTK